MIPIRLEIENFMAFGPRQVIDFSRDVLWVIGGPNGVGKSTVFDAMTYALFGYARGGPKQVNQLVRQNTRGCKVSFEFALAKQRYRIHRSRSSNGKPVQSLEVWEENYDCFQLVKQVVNAEDLKKWVSEQIGIEYETYTASVLLEQGKADAIILANGRERMNLLKRILGIDRFEKIHKKIEDDRKAAERRVKELQQKLSVLPVIREDDVRQAAAERERTEEAYIKADALYAAALAWPPQAEAWERLQGELTHLRRSLQEMNLRLARRPEIEATWARYQRLREARPWVERWQTLRPQREQATKRYHELQSQIVPLQTALQELESRLEQQREQARGQQQSLERLQQQQQEQQETWAALQAELQRAEQAEGLALQLARIPADLAGQISSAQKGHQQAKQALETARGQFSQIQAQQQQIQQQLQRLKTLGGTCSFCGQTVDAAHAAREQARLEAESATLRQQEQSLREQGQQLRDRYETCEQTLQALQGLQAQEKALQEPWQRLQRSRTRPTASLTELQQEAEALQSRRIVAQQQIDQLRQAQKQLRSEENLQEHRLKEFRRQHQQLHQEQLNLQLQLGQLEEKLLEAETILAGWQIDPQTASSLEAEWQQLEQQQPAAEYEALQLDLREADTRRQRELTLLVEIESIPAVARRPKAAVQPEVDAARLTRSAADAARSIASTQEQKIRQSFQQYQELIQEYLDIDKAAMRLKRLADYLGPEGLQRELVRRAAREITSFASKILDDLSNNKLSLERTEAGEEALELAVRKDGLPEPIDAARLSGGEKFRTSVALALAISRFAAGRMRPLECVMIDEGFGSLDEAGKENILATLNQLRSHLKRILVVSHERAFTEYFPSRIDLAYTQEGTQIQ